MKLQALLRKIQSHLNRNKFNVDVVLSATIKNVDFDFFLKESDKSAFYVTINNSDGIMSVYSSHKLFNDFVHKVGEWMFELLKKEFKLNGYKEILGEKSTYHADIGE